MSGYEAGTGDGGLSTLQLRDRSGLGREMISTAISSEATGSAWVKLVSESPQRQRSRRARAPLHVADDVLDSLITASDQVVARYLPDDPGSSIRFTPAVSPEP
jgi:hypothetical protein